MRIRDWSSDVCSSDLIGDLETRERETAESIRLKESGLRESLAGIDPALLDLDHAALLSRLAEDPEETDLGALVRTRRELEVSEESWRGAIVNDVGDRSAFESANKTARDDLDRWTAEHGPETDALLRSEGHTSELQSLM